MHTNIKPILFLDCDDVLNTPDRYQHAWNLDFKFLDDSLFDPTEQEIPGHQTVKGQEILKQAYAEAFTPEAVEILNNLQKKHGFETVISSSWARTFDKEGFMRIFKETGLNLVLHADWVTPKTNETNRAQEIYKWLEDHDHPKNFLILDDTCSGTSLLTNVFLRASTVFCDYECQTRVEDPNFRVLKGLNKNHLPDIKGILEEF